MQQGRRFEVRRIVRFHHCDPAGIVFYPRYLEMVNTVVEDWFAALGAPFPRIHGEGAHGVPTVRLAVEFTAPSRMGDALDFTLAPTRLGRSSVDLEIAARSVGETRLTLTATLVRMALSTGRSAPWPDDLRAAISTWLETEPADGA